METGVLENPQNADLLLFKWFEKREIEERKAGRGSEMEKDALSNSSWTLWAAAEAEGMRWKLVGDAM